LGETYFEKYRIYINVSVAICYDVWAVRIKAKQTHPFFRGHRAIGIRKQISWSIPTL
jgi:hypothetical protein